MKAFFFISDGPYVHSPCPPGSRPPWGPWILPALGPLVLFSGPAHFQPQASNGPDAIRWHQHAGRRRSGPGGRGPGLLGALSARNQRQPGGNRLARDGRRSGMFWKLYIYGWKQHEHAINRIIFINNVMFNRFYISKYINILTTSPNLFIQSYVFKSRKQNLQNLAPKSIKQFRL